jgi:hypothetical protein
MRFLSLLSLFSLFHKKRFIENGEYPLCKNCVYYLPSLVDIFSYEKYGKCAKYGTKNVVSGYISYNYASYCRIYSDNCGKEGKDFVARPDIITFINDTMVYFSEKSIKSRYIWEKIQSTNYNNEVKYTSKEKEEETEKETKINCIPEENNCSTEFCNECYSENCKKKSTKIVDTEIVSDKFTKY